MTTKTMSSIYLLNSRIVDHFKAGMPMTRGILVTNKDLAPLYRMHIQLQQFLDNHIPCIEKHANELVVSDAFTRGRIEQLLVLINQCHSDYLANGRNDAVDAICTQMNALGYKDI